MPLCAACAGPPHLMQFNGTCIQQKINEWVQLSMGFFPTPPTLINTRVFPSTDTSIKCVPCTM